MKKRFLQLSMFAAIIFAASSLFLTSCEDDENTDQDPYVEPTVVEEESDAPKYVFLLIGDGMSSPQINIAEAALANDEFVADQAKSTKDIVIGELAMTTKFQHIGMQTTHAEDRYITGSAASATALATGHKTTINTISMSGDHSDSYTTMAEMARDKGMKVGIVSSVSIDHATPAAFYAHTETRNNYDVIDQHLIDSDFDYFAGGCVRWNKWTDNLEGYVANLETAGYSFVNTRAAFEAVNAETGKVFATLNKFSTNTSDGCALPYVLDLDEYDTDNDITLSEFTAKGIEVLDNEDGFFMMVEGGKIDWACHANDVVSATHNTVEFDKVVQLAVDFYNEHPDETLIVVTGDHECGGLTLGYAGTGYETAFEILSEQKVSYLSYTNTVASWNDDMTFEQALESVKENFGLGDAEKNVLLALSGSDSTKLEAAFNRSMLGADGGMLSEEETLIYGYYDPFTVTVTHILNNKAGIEWASYSHTGTPVPVFALGNGAENFIGYYDNTDIGKRIIEVAELD